MAAAAPPTAAAFLLLAAIWVAYSPGGALSDPADYSCLSSLRSSLSDPLHRLRNWTQPNLSSPCFGSAAASLTSPLAGATCNNGRVFKLSLPSYSLSGSLPPLLSNCTSLQTLDLSDNQLTGPIPPQLSLLLNLAVLNLSGNHLSGQIPPQLALCAYLNVIDLHSNSLSGQIPDQLAVLARLSAFDVSYNDLDGPIPVLLANRSAGPGGGSGGPRFNASSFVGNRGLYGYPLAPARNRGLSVMAIVGIGLGSGLLSLVISFTAVCIWLRVTERSAAAVNGEEGKNSHFMPEY